MFDFLKKKDDLFCVKCGQELVNFAVPFGFDKKTGNKIFYNYKMCSERVKKYTLNNYRIFSDIPDTFCHGKIHTDKFVEAAEQSWKNAV